MKNYYLNKQTIDENGDVLEYGIRYSLWTLYLAYFHGTNFSQNGEKITGDDQFDRYWIAVP